MSKKTRNEHRRDLLDIVIGGLVAVGVMFIVTMLLCGMAVEAWNHPAEQPITYAEHIARFQ